MGFGWQFTKAALVLQGARRPLSFCAAKMATFPVSAARSASGPYHLGRDKRGLSRCGLRGRSFFHNGRDAGCIGFETFLIQNLDKN